MAGMLRIGSVGSLHRYPVKSMMGEELSATRIGARGLQGDRVFALADTETGKIASAKNPSKWPTLFRFQAAFTQPLVDAGPLPPVQITFPDGSTVFTGNGGIDAQLSSSLGKPVHLLSAAPRAGTLEEYWPDIEGLAQRDVVTDEAMPTETFFDVGVIHFITTGTLENFHALYPEGRFESRRFRPNLVIETAPGGSGFPESEWTERVLAIGEVKLKVTGACSRCVMTTLGQGDLPKDAGILKAAVRHNRAQAGAYASVVQGGVVRKGDEVRIEGG